MNKTLAVFAIGFALAAVVQYFAARALESSLTAEEAAHAFTRQERDDWKARAEAAATRAEALADNARRCLEREAQTQADAAERAAIMEAARPRARTAEEKNKVVDDETRRRAALRLNRPL